MVIRVNKQRNGFMVADLAVAMALILAVLLPLSFSLVSEQKLARSYYYRAVATEIVDGEVEMLSAGHWRDVPEGVSNYKVSAGSATNLPQGTFVVTRDAERIRLEWKPSQHNSGGHVVREVKVR